MDVGTQTAHSLEEWALRAVLSAGTPAPTEEELPAGLVRQLEARQKEASRQQFGLCLKELTQEAMRQAVFEDHREMREGRPIPRFVWNDLHWEWGTAEDFTAEELQDIMDINPKSIGNQCSLR